MLFLILKKKWDNSYKNLVLYDELNIVSLLGRIFEFFWAEIVFLHWVWYFFHRKPRNGILKIALLFPTLPTRQDKNTMGNRVPYSSLISLLLSIITKWCVGGREEVGTWIIPIQKLWTSAFTMSQGRVHKRRHEGVHWRMWLSPGHSTGRARRGTFGRDQPCPVGAADQLPAFSRSLCGDVEASGKMKFHKT